MPNQPKKQEKCGYCAELERKNQHPRPANSCLHDCHTPKVTIETENCDKCGMFKSAFFKSRECKCSIPELKQEAWEEEFRKLYYKCGETLDWWGDGTPLIDFIRSLLETKRLESWRKGYEFGRKEVEEEIIKKIEGIKKSNYRREKEVKERKLNAQQSRYLMAEYHGFNQALEDVIKEVLK